MVLEIIIARLGVTVEPEQDIAGFETEQVVTALGREKAYEISNILLLESEKNIKGREEALFFLLYFLLVTRVKMTSCRLIATLILEEDIGIRLEP